MISTLPHPPIALSSRYFPLTHFPTYPLEYLKYWLMVMGSRGLGCGWGGGMVKGNGSLKKDMEGMIEREVVEKGIVVKEFTRINTSTLFNSLQLSSTHFHPLPLPLTSTLFHLLPLSSAHFRFLPGQRHPPWGCVCRGLRGSFSLPPRLFAVCVPRHYSNGTLH